MDKSTHKVEVVKIKLEEHPNADSLSIVRIDGYTVCVRTSDWKDGDLGTYIPPDSLVDTSRPEFSFLGDHRRIKVKKLRGIVSMGLLVPAPPNSKEGDDVADILEVEHYEPETKLTMVDDNVPAPPGYHPKYDIDSIRKYNRIIKPREPVCITEKIHGANAKYLYHEGMYCGSRTNWKKESDTNIWWRALRNHPQIKAFCIENQDCVLYGEVYGKVQNMRYGKDDAYFMAFDIMHEGRWISVNEFLKMCNEFGIPTVPILGLDIPFDCGTMEEMADGPSTVPGANHCREGCVVKPMIERYDDKLGRVILKLVGNDYYLKGK